LFASVGKTQAREKSEGKEERRERKKGTVVALIGLH
jgi:hypothetical protein